MAIKTIALGAALLGLLAAAPAAAQTIPAREPDATFYETTENTRMLSKGKPRRVAQSALIGVASFDTPFCPKRLVLELGMGPVPCTLNALGADDISVRTGLGTFAAAMTIVTNEPGSVDSPEVLVDKLSVSGDMDFAPALVNGIPYGTITGRVHNPGTDGHRARFFGVFRLPFACGPAFCYLALDTVTGTVVLDQVVPLQANEFAIGFPAVRFDVWFQ
jgi:hypothetical protein